MTRDEAINKLLPVCEPDNKGPYLLASHLSAGAFVDSLVALGLFALEPKNVPKTRRELFKDALEKKRYYESGLVMLDALAAFDESDK